MDENKQNIVIRTKDEAIGYLITLRAGMSAIAVEASKAKKTIENEKQLKSQIEKEKTKKVDLYDKNAELELELEELEKEYANRSKKLSKDEKKRAVSVIGKIYFWISLIVFIGLMVGYFATDNFNWAPVCIIPMLVIICFFYWVSKWVEKYEISNLKKELGEKGSKINNLKNESLHIKNYEITNIEQNIQSLCIMYENQKKQFKTDVNQAKQKANQIYNTLEKSFSSLILPADWRHVDLIIFYLNSGRADTVKESLQLLDHQLQANMIANEIAKASNVISRSIEVGFAGLKETIYHCTTSIIKSNLILQNSMYQQTNSMLQAASNVNNQLSDILDATNLSNAMKQKQNARSEELIAEWKYIHYLNY